VRDPPLRRGEPVRLEELQQPRGAAAVLTRPGPSTLLAVLTRPGLIAPLAALVPFRSLALRDPFSRPLATRGPFPPNAVPGPCRQAAVPLPAARAAPPTGPFTVVPGGRAGPGGRVRPRPVPYVAAAVVHAGCARGRRRWIYSQSKTLHEDMQSGKHGPAPGREHRAPGRISRAHPNSAGSDRQPRRTSRGR
jgi:hypothetical protein